MIKRKASAHPYFENNKKGRANLGTTFILQLSFITN